MPNWQNNRRRELHFAARSSTLDKEARTVDAVIATGAWVDGFFGPERLVMAPEAVDMTRARVGLPWHDTHGLGGFGHRVGVAENVRLEDGELRATLRASRNAEGEAQLNDIEDGIITHTSIGFEVRDAEPTEAGLVITQWTPLEVSTPSVVADIGSTIQRTANMAEPVAAISTDEPDEIRANAETAARQRIKDIDAAFRAFPAAGELRTRAVDEDWEIDRVNTELLAWAGARYQTVGRGSDVYPGEDSVEKFVRGASEGLQVRAMLITGKEADEARRVNEYCGYSLTELAREYLRRANDSARGDAKSMVGRALVRAGIVSHSTSDFANILVDAANKSLQTGYDEAPETYEVWTRAGTLPDFKTGHRPKMSTFSDLEEVGETGEITYGTFSDFKETIALLAYARLFSISRKAIIDDDLNALSTAPRGMGRAARRKVGDLVYGVLSANAAMSDGNALFSAAHGNYVAAGAGAVPSVDSFNAAYTAMATQTDPAGNTLNVTPQFGLFPHALRGTTDALLQSVLNPGEGGTTAFQETNIWRARITPVYEARIDADDAAKWYLASSPAVADTIEVAYLNGVREPRMEQEESITVQGVTLSVAHDVGVAPLDWRFLYHNDGN